MNRRIIVSLLLVLVMLLPSFMMMSCDNSEGNGGETASGLRFDDDGKLIVQTMNGEKHIAVKKLTANDLAEYTAMCADLAATAVSSSVMTLKNTLAEKVGAIKGVGTDWVDRGTEMPVGTKEILLGFTNRPESPTEDNMRLNDYVIKYENNRLVICGGSNDATLSALDFYMSNFIDADRKELLVPEEPLKCEYAYTLATATVNGYSLADYKLKATSDYRAGKTPIQEFVSTMTGFEYKGKGDRAISIEGGADANTCSVMPSGNDIIIKCSEEITAEIAVRYFLSLLFEGDVKMNSEFQNAELNITEEKVFRPEDAASLPTVEIFVATTGNDITGNGTKDAPLATVDAARKKAREYARSTMAPINVVIRGGDYYLDSPVEFDLNDSGSEFAPITYKAYEGETVTLLGSTKIDPSLITKVTDEAILNRVINKDAAGKLMQIDLSKIYSSIPRVFSYDNIGLDSEYPFTVYCGDTALSRSRYPNAVRNEGYLKTQLRLVKNSDGSKTIFYDGDTAERINKYWSEDAKKHLYVHGYLGQEWTSEAYDASDINYANESITIHGAVDSGNFENFKGGSRYYFFNLPEEIDVPGESYIDYDNRIIYFYPTDNFNADNVYVGTLNDSMFKLRDTSNITVEGIRFMYTRKNAIDIRSTKSEDNLTAKRNLTVKNCTIAHTSWNGLTAYGTDIKIIGCDIYDTANGGISITGGSRPTLTPGNSIIENCIIHDFNRSERVYMPGIGAASVGLVIRNNEIYNGVHEMIAINSNDVVVEYNEIYNAVTESSDMGAIYFGRDPSLMGIVIRYNFLHEIGNAYGGSGQQGIYVDDGNAGALIYGNIFREAAGTDCKEPGAVKTHGSQFTQVYNNIFIDTEYGYDGASWGGGLDNAQALWYRWLFDRVPDKPHNIIDRVVSANYDSQLWREHYEGTIWANMYDYINSDLIALYKNKTDAEMLQISKDEAPRYTNKLYNNVVINSKIAMQLWGKNYEETNTVTADKSIFVKDGSDYSLTEAGLASIQAEIPDLKQFRLTKSVQQDNSVPNFRALPRNGGAGG